MDVEQSFEGQQDQVFTLFLADSTNRSSQTLSPFDKNTDILHPLLEKEDGSKKKCK